MNAVIEIFEEQCETNSQCQRQHKGQHHGTHSRRAHRKVGRDCVINDRNIIGSSRQHHVVFFRALEQIIEQAFVCLDLLLEDAIVDRGFVLSDGLAFLLIERLAEGVFAGERLPIFGFQIGE